MKPAFKLVLVVSVVLNVFLALIIAKRASGPAKMGNETSKLFSITNLGSSTASSGYVVIFQDGKYWWTIDGDVLSMNAGIDQEVTLRLEKDSGRVKSTTTELFDTNGAHCYFTDFNADGIPDKKRIGGDENWQIFYGGRFVPSFAQGKDRYILNNGTNLAVKFTGNCWTAIE